MNDLLLGKLKKLLNLSKSANIHEAELALQKATAMAAEAGIDLAMVSAKAESEAEKLEMVQETAFNGKRLPSLQKYASWLAASTSLATSAMLSLPSSSTSLCRMICSAVGSITRRVTV